MQPGSHTAARRRSRASGVVVAFLLMAALVAACGSGPSDDALARNRQPSTTTTTEPLPEGVTIVRIDGGAFRPANLKLDLDETWIVQWENRDAEERELTATRGEFESGPLQSGGTFEVDFREFEPGLYRYQMFIGQQRIPGIVDTRPAQ